MMAAAAAALIAMCLLLTGCDGTPDSGDSPQVRESVSQKETEQAAPEEAPQPAAEQDDAQEEAERAAQEAAAQEAADQAAQEAAAQEAANQAAQEAAAQEAANQAAQEAAQQEEVREQAPTSVYYASCADARAAGAAPLYEGDPGYRSQLDRDHDGIACE